MEDINKDNKDNTTTLTDAQIWVERDCKIIFPLMSLSTLHLRDTFHNLASKYIRTDVQQPTNDCTLFLTCIYTKTSTLAKS